MGQPENYPAVVTYRHQSLMIQIARYVTTFMAGILLFSAQASAQNLTLNLKDADINALIGTISEVTGTNFIVDPRVKGKVTVISSKAMPADEAYQVFLSILKVHGFAAIPFGSVVKIVPDVSAKQDAIPTVNTKSPGKGDEIVTRIVQVDNVSAAQLVPILRPMVPQQGHLAAYPDSNVLIISDRAANIERLVGLIHSIDKAGDNEIEVIPLEHAAASEMVRILGTLYKQAGAKNAAKSKVTMAADERTNSIILAGERGTRMRIRATISQLDTAPEQTGNTHVVFLRYAKAEDLAPVLTGLGKTKQAETKGKGKAAGAASTTAFDIQADDATNALVITAPPDIFTSLQGVIRQLDIRRAQVHIEAILVEVSPETTKQLGVQWLVADEGIGVVAGSVFDNAGSTITSAALNPIGSAGTGLNLGVIDGVIDLPGLDGTTILNMNVLIQALDNDINSNVLATPSIVTLDNEEAEIIVADNVPFLTGSFTTDTSGASNPFQTIERQDVGLILKVTPQVNEGSTVLLKISQEASSVKDSSTSSADIITQKRIINTTVMVDDGDILVLGGLISENAQENIQKLPFLGNLPLIGWLFSSRSTTYVKTNLMVFIKPTILRDFYDSQLITSQKYRHMRALQLERHEEGIALLPNVTPPLLPALDEADGAASIIKPVDVPAEIAEPEEASDPLDFL